MALTVTRLPDEPWEAITLEWQALDLLRPVRVPFSSPLWARLWWTHFRRDTLRARDELAVYTLRDPDGALVAVAPMMVTHRPGRSRLCTRELQFLGADTNVTELRGMTARPGRENECAQALMDHLDNERVADFVQWHGLPLGLQRPGFHPSGTVTDFVLTLEPAWDALRARLPRNVKQSLRKGHNSLARDGHAFRTDVLEGAALGNGLKRLYGLHAMRARLAGTVSHIDIFAQPQARAFLAEYVQRSGTARLFALDIGGAHVAMRLGFLYDRQLYLYYSGFDPAWSQYSVMTTLLGEAIRWAIGQGLERVNLSTGSDVAKTRWRPEAIDTGSGFQVHAGLRSRLSFRAAATLRRKPLPLQDAA